MRNQLSKEIRLRCGCLAEHLPHFAQQRATHGLVLDRQRLLQLFEQFPLVLGELGGCLHLHLHHQVAATAAIQLRNTFAADLECRSRLCSFGNSQPLLAFQSGHRDFRPKCRLCNRDWNHTVQVPSVTLEKLVLVAVEHHIQIARGPAEHTRFALSRVENALAVFHTSRDLHRHRARLAQTTMSVAFRTGLDDQRAGSLAGAAGSGHREEALLIPHLSLAVAGGTGYGRFTRSRSAAVAVFAFFQPAHLHLLGDSKDRLFKLQCYVFANVGATLRTRPPPAPRAPEYVTEAEQVAKDILKVDKG